jgi:uncharacterized protein YndB with AHSA1/START domain
MMESKAKSRPKPRSRGDYACHVSFNAPRAQVFDAVATIKGLRGWWTPITGGSPATGGQLRFEFKGLDECIIMRVDRARRPDSVHWTCVMHTGLTEWRGTKVTFDLAGRTAKTCELRFRHVGLKPKLSCYDNCRQGWEHFLASLIAYVERGQGMPFGL